MANKRRAKKIQAPYRRYVYRLNFTEANSSDEEEEEDVLENDVAKKDVYGTTLQNFKANSHIISTYVLTNRFVFKGNIWPRSQFEKIDVLQCALTNQNKNFEENMERAKFELENELKLMKLPVEIIVKILEILDARGKLKPKFLRVCKLFYLIAFPMIYRRPHLKATNFFLFVETMSLNKKSGEYVQELDLSSVIQSGKNAFVLKLLKRSKKQLRVFVAPQTSFGLAPLLSLKNCHQLRILDLRLVSETLDLRELFNSIEALQNLTHLSFPRSSVAINNFNNVNWPPQLSFLRLSGGISDDFLLETKFPSTITQLEFSHCPAIKEFGFQQLIRKMGKTLKTLKVQYPMPGLREKSLDPVFYYCPNLLVLEVAVDYVSSSFFDEENLGYMEYPRPLKTMYLESSGMLGTSTRLDPIDLAVALNDERLPNLKNIRCTAKLGWDPKSEYVDFIVNALDERGGGIYIGY